MKISKSLRKIIVYKTINRRISAIIKTLEKDDKDVYFKDGSKYNGWPIYALTSRMLSNSNRILFIRAKMKESKNGT